MTYLLIVKLSVQDVTHTSITMEYLKKNEFAIGKPIVKA